MGMFDTIIFETPITCANCGARISSTQTKHFDPMLACYRVGDVISGIPTLTGVLEERLYCNACHALEQKIYLTIWHSLLTGIYLSLEEAEARVFQVDRADILNHLIRHQEEERAWKGRFSRLHGLLRTYHEYLAADDKDAFFGGFGGIFRSELKEYLEAGDPLSKLLEKQEPPEEEGLF
jgi:hypothetical protein